MAVLTGGQTARRSVHHKSRFYWKVPERRPPEYATRRGIEIGSTGELEIFYWDGYEFDGLMPDTYCYRVTGQ